MIPVEGRPVVELKGEENWKSVMCVELSDCIGWSIGDIIIEVSRVNDILFCSVFSLST